MKVSYAKENEKGKETLFYLLKKDIKFNAVNKSLSMRINLFEYILFQALHTSQGYRSHSQEFSLFRR